MELWTAWVHFLEASLGLLVSQFGLSEAIAIIVLTVIARMLFLPISLTAAYRMQKNKAVLERLKPALEELRHALKDDPAKLAAQSLALYRKNGVTFFDKLSLLNIGSQGAFGIGVFQCLKRTAFSSKFLWIANLAKPDIWLTGLVAALMLLSMLLMPDASGNASMLLMFAISVLVSVVAIAALPSALGIYWATSNAVTVVQTLALRYLLLRRRHIA
jgi:YidC/Oxa1 family membrane protein insertase